MINLKCIKDSDFVTSSRKQAEEYLSEAIDLGDRVSAAVRKEFETSR